MVERGELLAFEEQGVYRFPAFQFAGTETIPHLADVLRALSIGNNSPEAKCSFFLTKLGFLYKTPADVLTGSASTNDVECILRAASRLDQHTEK